MKIAPIKIGIIKSVPFGFKTDKESAKIDKTLSKSDIKTKYYHLNYITGKEIPENITSKNIPNGEILYRMKNGISHPFDGFKEEIKDGKTIRKTHYFNGFPLIITDYKNNEPFMETRYSIKTHKKECVRSCDGSFKLEKREDEDFTTLDFYEDKGDETVSLIISAPKEKGMGDICCLISTNDSEGEMEVNSRYLSWHFPKMSVDVRKNKDNKEMTDVLKHFQDIICSSEYKNDFGETESLNIQLREVIKYLEKPE